MTNGTDPATQDLNQKVSDLEAEAAPKLDDVENSLTGAVWDAIKDFITLLFVGRWQDGIDYIPDVYTSVADTAAGKAQTQKQALSASSLMDRLTAESSPRAIVEFYEQLLADYPILHWIMGVMQLVSGLAMTLLAETSATKELFWQSVWKRDRPALLPTESMLALFFKDPSAQEYVREHLTKYGYTDEYIENLITSSQEKLSPDAARAAFLRGSIDEAEHDDILKASRYTDDTIAQLKVLYEQIPPIQDLIVMAVREVFSPEIAAQFGQYEDFPEQLQEVAAKVGLTEEWAQRYWAAHWSLPSVSQAFEMLHRGVINDEEVTLLLRALDIMPYWRDRLTQISYNPYTRVDVRRMYQLGVLDEEDVLRAYLDLGYDQEKAEKMTEFTIKYQAEQDKDLTKTDIVDLYKRSAIDHDTATNMLKEIGYSADNADLILTRAALEVLSDIKQKTIAVTQKLYVSGKYTDTQVYQNLGELDLASTEVNQLLQLWDLDKKAKIRYLTYEQIGQLYKAKIINEVQVKTELRQLGYDDQVAVWLTRLITGGTGK